MVTWWYWWNLLDMSGLIWARISQETWVKIPVAIYYGSKHLVPSQSLTWKLKIASWNRIPVGTIIFRFLVQLREGTSWYQNSNPKVPYNQNSSTQWQLPRQKMYLMTSSPSKQDRAPTFFFSGIISTNFWAVWPMVAWAPTSNKSGSCKLKTLIFAPSPTLAPRCSKRGGIWWENRNDFKLAATKMCATM